MADKKISELTSGAPAVATDALPVARSGVTRKLTLADVWNLPSASQLTWNSDTGLKRQSLSVVQATDGSSGSGFFRSTGIYLGSAGDTFLGRAAANVLSMGSSGTDTIRGGSGSASAPTYSFTAGTNYGLYYESGGGCLGLGIAGVRAILLGQGSGNVSLVAAGQFNWSSTADAAGTKDTGLARSAAGIVKATNGSSGNGKFQSGDGDSANPAYAFANSSTTGMYNVGSGFVGFYSSGQKALAFSSTEHIIPSGSVLNWSSTSDTSAARDTGMKRLAAGIILATNGSTGYGGLAGSALATTDASGTYTNDSSSGRASASGVAIQWSNSATDANGTKDTGLARSAAGVVKATNGSTGIRGFLGGGSSVASATALPVPTGRVFHVTGTNNITSITSTNFESGAVITLIFDDVLTFTDGNNLKLAGNFVTTADDTITLAYDGSNWYETSRSVN